MASRGRGRRGRGARGNTTSMVEGLTPNPLEYNIDPIPYLSFNYVDEDLFVGFNDEETWYRYVGLRGNLVLPTRWAHRPTMDLLGVYNDVATLANRNGFTRVFNANESTYQGMTLEFLASLETDNPDRPTWVKFQLFGNTHKLTMTTFGQMLGLRHIPGGIVKPKQNRAAVEERQTFWRRITRSHTLFDRHAASMKVRNPALRYYLRVFTESLIPTSGTDHNVKNTALACLQEAYEQRQPSIDLAGVVLNHMIKQNDSPNAICWGGLVTIIAKHCGFDENGPYSMSLVPGDIFIDQPHINTFLFRVRRQTINPWIYKITETRAMRIPQPSRTTITDPINIGMPIRNNEYTFSNNSGWTAFPSHRGDDEYQFEEEMPEFDEAQDEGDDGNSNHPHYYNIPPPGQPRRRDTNAGEGSSTTHAGPSYPFYQNVPPPYMSQFAEQQTNMFENMQRMDIEGRGRDEQLMANQQSQYAMLLDHQNQLNAIRTTQLDHGTQLTNLAAGQEESRNRQQNLQTGQTLMMGAMNAYLDPIFTNTVGYPPDGYNPQDPIWRPPANFDPNNPPYSIPRPHWFP